MPKGKKKGSKKGKKGKGSETLAYNDWVKDMNNAFETKYEIKHNENVIEDCTEASNKHNVRDYLWKFPEDPDPDDEEIKFDEYKIKTVLYQKVVCYYFAGLRQDTVEEDNITDILLEAYGNALQAGKKIEVVLISLDKKKEHFDEFFEKMPWYAIPWGDKKIDYLKLQYKVKEVPRLVIVGQNGQVVLDDGIKKLRSPQAGAFPFTKAASHNVVEIAQRRPNRNPCTVMDAKCKQFVGSKMGDEVQPDGSIIKMPVSCGDCGCADIYHIPERELPEDKAKAAKGKGGKKKK